MPIDFPSRLDLHALGRQHVLARAKRIDPSQVDVEGSDVNIIVASASFVNQQVVLQLAQKTNALLLDGARGDDLDRWVFDRCDGLTRKGAVAAVGSVRFFRTSIAAGAGSVAEGTKLASLTGIEYITTSQATFGASSTEATASVRAVLAGKSTQVGKNFIRRISNSSSLFDSSLQVTNDEPTAGGEDREEDDVFRERARLFFRSARRGVLGAIEFGALAVPGVASAFAQEVLTPNNQPARVVELFIADSSGVANAQLAAAVRVSLNEYRAAGIFVLVSLSVPQIVSVILSPTFVAGVDTVSISENMRAAIFSFINSLGANNRLYRADLYSVIRRFTSDGLIPSDSTIVEPVGDLIPPTGYTLRTTMSDIQFAA